jgi:hypothetical protein
MSEDRTGGEQADTPALGTQAGDGPPAQIAAAHGYPPAEPDALLLRAPDRKRKPPPMQFVMHMMTVGPGKGDLLADVAELRDALGSDGSPPSKDKKST